jgi:hypothetical protein
MPFLKRKKAKAPKKAVKKGKTVNRKGTPKKLEAKFKRAGLGTKYRGAISKVFNSSVSHIDELLPLVLTAASRAGTGTYVGLGLSGLAMLSQNAVAKTAIQMLIAKSKDVAHRYADDGMTFYRDVTRDTVMFEDAEAEISTTAARVPRTRRMVVDLNRLRDAGPYRGMLGAKHKRSSKRRDDGFSFTKTKRKAYGGPRGRR